jgi:hypothetical protein
MAEGMDLTIENLKDRLIDIKSRISVCRKKGLYTKIVELKIMQIPSKIKYLEATRVNTDTKKVNLLLNDADKDLKEIEKDLDE